MRRVLKAGFLALTLIVVTTPKLPALERMPAGSFLVYRVNTVAGLAKQVAGNRALKTRYARHFAIAPDRVAESFSQGLKTRILKSPLKTRMWYIDKNGRSLSKATVLPKNAVVFASKDGSAILAGRCGNPLRASLPSSPIAHRPSPPKKVIANAAGTMTNAIETASTGKPVETKVMASQTETVTAPIAAQPEPVILASAPNAEPMIMAALPSPPIAIAPAIAGTSLSWLAGLGGLAGLAVAEASQPTREETPEPSSLAVLGAGLFTIPLAFSRLKRSQVRR